jgi:hypothetical protein
MHLPTSYALARFPGPGRSTIAASASRGPDVPRLGRANSAAPGTEPTGFPVSPFMLVNGCRPLVTGQ